MLQTLYHPVIPATAWHSETAVQKHARNASESVYQALHQFFPAGKNCFTASIYGFSVAKAILQNICTAVKIKTKARRHTKCTAAADVHNYFISRKANKLLRISFFGIIIMI